MDELFRSDNVVVRRVPTDDLTRWVVTFDHYGIGHGFDRPGFGEPFLQSRGISAIHVMGCREDWYQYPEMIPAMAAVREAVAGADRVMTYGTSMGAYAALRFADAAGANAALALSPQYSIDPVKAPHDRRWAQDSYRIRWLADIEGPIRCRFRPVIAYDPNTMDAWHAQRIVEDIAVTAIRLPNASHPAATFLAEVGMLEPLLFDVLNGTEDLAAIIRQARTLRGSSAVYLSELALKQPAWRRRTAVALARRAVVVSSGNEIAKLALAKLLTEAGEHDESLKLHREIHEVYGDSIDFFMPYVDALRASGDGPRSAEMARQAVKLSPHLANVHAWAAVMLWQNGEKRDALEFLQRAVALDPHNRNYDEIMLGFENGGVEGWVQRQGGAWRRTKRWLNGARLGRREGSGLLT